MEILYGFEAVQQDLGPIVMTIGTFDGLHLGHRAIVERIVDRARKTGTRSLVYSFYPPPWRILGVTRANPYLILSLQDKIDLLHGLGVDLLLTEEFNPDLQQMPASRFADEVLRRRLNPREIHVGYDFRFGRGREGDWRFLARHFAGTEIKVRPHGAVRVDGDVVSCTRVRTEVVEGRLLSAGRLLGRRHFISGVVVRGRGRGSTIGFPTANIAPSTELLPPPGVYAVELIRCRDGAAFPGVANLGFRPTFAERDFSIEAHLFDFEGDLYGERVRLDLVRKVRDERRFDGAEALIRQIHKDAAEVRAMLPFGAPEVGTVSWDPKPV